MADPVHIFAADHPRQYRNLRQKLLELYKQQLESVLNAQDWADFRFRVGRIRGIGDAVNFCEELEKEERK